MAGRPAPERPLPRLDEPDTGPFWRATRARRLTYPQCDDCGAVVFYPRRHCNRCLSSNLVWREASGFGSIYTFSVVRQSYHPFFRTRVPYAVGYVDLDEGPRLLTNLVGIDHPTTDLHIGQRVRVQWEDHEELALPLFRPLALIRDS